MVSYTCRTVLGKGKNSDGEPRGRQRSETSSSISPSDSTPYLDSDTPTVYEEESSIDSLVWPVKREDCEWVADKVRQPGGQIVWPTSRDKCKWVSGRNKRAEVDHGVFRDEIVSYGVRPAFVSPDRTLRKNRLARKEPPRSRSSKMREPHDTHTTVRKPKRQPLRDITEVNINIVSVNARHQTQAPDFQPSHAIPSDWHQSLIDFLNARKERDDLSAIA